MFSENYVQKIHLVPYFPVDCQTFCQWNYQHEELQKMEENIWHGQEYATHATEVKRQIS